jgi:methyl-accepting chemotaxis protein
MATVAVVALLAVFFVAEEGMSALNSSFNTVVDQQLPKIVEAEKIIVGQVTVQRDIRELVIIKDSIHRQEISARIDKERADLQVLLDSLNDQVATVEAKAILVDIHEKLGTMATINNHIRELALAAKNEEAELAVAQPEVLAHWNALRASLQALVDLQKARAQTLAANGKEKSKQANLWIMSIAVLAIILLVVIALMVIRSVSGAINDIVTNVMRVVRDMSFTVRLPVRNDELNAVSSSLNTMLGNLETAVADANRVVGAIARGDFSQRITQNYVGDLDHLKQGINGSVTNIDDVMLSLSTAMTALQTGQFSFQVNTSVPGAFGSMMQGVSQAMSELNGVVRDINHIMHKLNQGEFDARVTSDARGDLSSLKLAVNETLDTLDHLTGELVHMAQAQMEGDLTVVSHGEYKGRFQELQQARTASTSKIKEIINLATQAADTVSDAAAQVSQGSSDLSARVQEQASALEETSATMKQMASAVQTNTANAQKVAALTGEVQHQAQDGALVMQQTIGAMQAIRESSNKIADIVSIIDSIAFQTNLLALNAAVEAARAGEHGRGFAVVASEVRALAGKSAEAAKDIKGLIQDSVDRVENGTHLAEKSGEMLAGITQSIEQVASMAGQIANASGEQAVGIAQVHQAVSQIDEVTQQNAALVEETTAAALSLSNEAKHLHENMAFFNTGYVAKSAVGEKRKSAVTALPATLAPVHSEAWSDF